MRINNKDTLNDILHGMKLASDFLEDQSLEVFRKDEKTLYAVIRCLEVIGEAVKRLPDDIRDANPDIPWKAMAGMRDRLIHGYDVVDPEIVWITVRHTISDLYPKIKEINNELEKST